ncbi:hypothetical protein MZD04_gp380 [Pseudomonas phage Psa21]|uniref:Uncharacterized protein n=1 Tax=Pseudomonas phage Psa21 TaxID=2530023 RepID=A0A481W4Y8_9CAUD|nr:hypothetical protein MZD04_gp380 [Pseudomonas phage Psa21]QBJ02906.1 hypothetical protein PSA21_380 [Pseudomonas phage Psa21]
MTTIKEHAIAKLHVMAENPEYIEYLTVKFPEWMSHSPGGLNYLPNVFPNRLTRVRRWMDATIEIIRESQRLGIGLNGYPAPMPPPGSMEEPAVFYSVAGKIRDARKGWKNHMRLLDFVPCDDLWRCEDARSGAWEKEWKEFRELVYSEYGIKN